jgi:3alpha(or 20beta)-hydroxysteroid dehydrogenase
VGELSGKIALVTGAARGLGAAIVEVFHREGAKVVVTDRLAREGAELAQRLGQDTAFVEHDVTDESHWKRAVDFAIERFGRLDIVVNNAGLVGLYPFDQTPPEIWHKLVAVMQTGPYLGMRAAIPRMLAADGGVIVNIASTNAILGMAQSAAYTAAKHGVLGLTRSLALEYAGAGIRINAVCPGSMRTPMLQECFGAEMETFSSHVPLGRLADPHEVAELVSFVASPRASYCVGATFVADGGMSVG